MFTRMFKGTKQEGAAPGSHCIVFDFGHNAMQKLDELKEQTGAANYAEVVQNALRTYEWVHKQESEGNSIGLFRNGEPLKRGVKFLY